MMYFIRIFVALLFCVPCFAQDSNSSASKPEHCYDDNNFVRTWAECVEEKDLPTATFSPAKGVEATVVFKKIPESSSTNGTESVDSSVHIVPVYTITSNGNTIQEKIASGNVPKAIIVEDYNFDGLMDFSIIQYEGGMEINNEYRVFIYSKKLNRFLEYAPFPNLIIDKKKKQLLYTCWESTSTIPKQCAIKLSDKTVIKAKNESP